jgi:hypothetical protein
MKKLGFVLVLASVLAGVAFGQTEESAPKKSGFKLSAGAYEKGLNSIFLKIPERMVTAASRSSLKTTLRRSLWVL